MRNITGCPVAGLDAHELFDCSELMTQVADHFYGNPDFTNLPRKHKHTIASCADRCNVGDVSGIAHAAAGLPGPAVVVVGEVVGLPKRLNGRADGSQLYFSQPVG